MKFYLHYLNLQILKKGDRIKSYLLYAFNCSSAIPGVADPEGVLS